MNNALMHRSITTQHNNSWRVTWHTAYIQKETRKHYIIIIIHYYLSHTGSAEESHSLYISDQIRVKTDPAGHDFRSAHGRSSGNSCRIAPPVILLLNNTAERMSVSECGRVWTCLRRVCLQKQLSGRWEHDSGLTRTRFSIFWFIKVFFMRDSQATNLINFN